MRGDFVAIHHALHDGKPSVKVNGKVYVIRPYGRGRKTYYTDGMKEWEFVTQPKRARNAFARITVAYRLLGNMRCLYEKTVITDKDKAE